MTSWTGNNFLMTGPLWGESGGNSPATLDFPHKGTVTWKSLWRFFVASLNKLLNKPAVWFVMHLWFTRMRYPNSEMEMSSFFESFVTCCIDSCQNDNFCASSEENLYPKKKDISVSFNTTVQSHNKTLMTVIKSFAPGRFEWNFWKVDFQAIFTDWWLRYIIALRLMSLDLTDDTLKPFTC